MVTQSNPTNVVSLVAECYLVVSVLCWVGALLVSWVEEGAVRPAIVCIMEDMDQISIKTPNPKCRLYWCLIEFIDWGCSQSCWYFRPLA